MQSPLVKWVLHKGARKGLKIEANKNTLLFVSLGRGSFNLNEETYARLIDYNDPDYNIFVRTNTPENTILSSWRLKEPVQSENSVPEIDLTLEFYKDDQLPQLRVRQNIKAENLRIIKDKIKTNVEPIKDIFFK
ncbi:hypothetical protein Noda2021_06090 [Candidatus Dependentiae bacterium Noda2021]|nr:hypothetical protein Noda2021_06090 [Candidatus Dependentiae bacterium Noda2021]